MLQINTGKLYSRGVGRINALTGVLHTNARLPRDDLIQTMAGSLRGAGHDRLDRFCVFDMDERLEAVEEGPGVLVSHGVGPFLDDMAIVATIGLNAIFTRRSETLSSLTGDGAGFSSYRAPKEFIAGLFDREIYIRDETAAEFETFVSELLALNRKSYLAAMRAMRMLVAGLHRIPDDLGLAYTLMVSAVESLALDFDGHSPKWEEVDGRKRNAVDLALEPASREIVNAVREAILATEHLALSRRYRAFVSSHVDGEYFRSAPTGGRPIARWELEPALRQAYALRSGYIHQVKVVPDEIGMPFGHWEVVSSDRKPLLTLAGLYRLSRHVVRTFIRNSEKLEVEPYDYRSEEAGIVMVEMAPQYWVWQPLVDPADAIRRLEGQLSLAASVISGEPNAQLVNLRPVLADVERLIDQASHEQRVALINFHLLFNLMVSPSERTPEFNTFLETHGDEANEPGPISVIVSTILEATNNWALEAHAAAIEDYFAQRTRRRGLHAPRLFEAAALLELAEKMRLSGEFESSRQNVSRAVEAHPGHKMLREFEDGFNTDRPIAWRAILIPQKPVDDGAPGP